MAKLRFRRGPGRSGRFSVISLRRRILILERVLFLIEREARQGGAFENLYSRKATGHWRSYSVFDVVLEREAVGQNLGCVAVERWNPKKKEEESLSLYVFRCRGRQRRVHGEEAHRKRCSEVTHLLLSP